MTNRDELPQYSRRIVSLREGLGLSQKALAHLVGVTAPAVTMWESGIRFPRGKALSRLAKALGVSQSYLLDDSEAAELFLDLSEAELRPKTRQELIGDIILALASFNESQLTDVASFISNHKLFATDAAPSNDSARRRINKPSNG
jgi:transcriptional regulator with XRE-family HTH domain